MTVPSSRNRNRMNPYNPMMLRKKKEKKKMSFTKDSAEAYL